MKAPWAKLIPTDTLFLEEISASVKSLLEVCCGYFENNVTASISNLLGYSAIDVELRNLDKSIRS